MACARAIGTLRIMPMTPRRESRSTLDQIAQQIAARRTQARVRVGADGRGGWEVAFPDLAARVVCETLCEARHVGFLSAAHRGPCELVICDAYHRVVHHELIQVGQRPPRDERPTRENRGR
jgi:hypothetical protein